MRAHFDDRVLAVVPAAYLAGEIAEGAADLRSDLVVIAQGPMHAHVQLAGVRYLATVNDVPPYRLLSLQGFPIGARIRDTRLTGPSAGPPGTSGPPPRTLGPVPPESPRSPTTPAPSWAWPPWCWPAATRAATRAAIRPAIRAARRGCWRRGGPTWTGPRCWTPVTGSRPRGSARWSRRPPCCAWCAGGRIGLDARASDYLTTVRLGDEAVTVAELLSHTAGVDDPAVLFGDRVPADLAALTGPVVPCHGPRGEVRPSNGGYAVLGQLIADVTGTSFAQAVTRLVLAPLGLRDSGFPARTADIGEGAVSGYSVTADGIFVPVPARICTIQAVGGLWSTGADLVRLGTGWPSLLPPALARQALIPRISLGGTRLGGAGVGLGWLISAGGATAVHRGMGSDATASLLNRVRDNRTHVVLTNRQITLDTIEDRLRRSWTDPSPES